MEVDSDYNALSQDWEILLFRENYLMPNERAGISERALGAAVLGFCELSVPHSGRARSIAKGDLSDRMTLKDALSSDIVPLVRQF